MKKIAAIACAVGLSCVLASCSGGDAQNQQSTDTTGESQPAATSTQVAAGSAAEVLEAIKSDFSSTSASLAEALESVDSAIGGTYQGYIDNEQVLLDWYAKVENDTKALGDRTLENSAAYFKAVANEVDHEDSRALEDALDEFYDTVYEDVFDDYYDAIYEDAYDSVYDTYYDGVTDDAYDTEGVEYKDWSDVHSDCYKEWSRSRSEMYKQWSRYRSDVYSMRSDVYSAFYQDNFDVDSILGESASSDDAETVDEQGTPVEDTSSSADGVDPDFKAAMDEYEAFFDEYVDFMVAYKEGGMSTDMLSDYTDLMSQYTETMASYEEIDTGSLSEADALYYTEVSSRITEKLLEVA